MDVTISILSSKIPSYVYYNADMKINNISGYNYSVSSVNQKKSDEQGTNDAFKLFSFYSNLFHFLLEIPNLILNYNCIRLSLINSIDFNIVAI